MVKVGQIYNNTILGGELVVTWIREDKTEIHLLRDDGFFFTAKELDSNFKLIAEYSTWQEAVSALNSSQAGDAKVNHEPSSYSCRACKNAMDNELARARLALAQIHEVVDEVYFWDKGWAIGDLYCDKVEEIGRTLQEYFGDDKQQVEEIEDDRQS